VPNGDVISQNPTGGTQVASGSSVDIEVSIGPAPVSVPNVVGQAQATAESNITGAGLVVGTVSTNYSPTVPSGDVISQNPTGGTQVSSGSSVDIVVSLGSAPVAGPPACIEITPTNAGVNDQVTLSAYDASDNWVDMRNFTGIEICFDDDLCIFVGGGLDVSSGDGVFTLTSAILAGYKFDCAFDSTWFTLVNPSEGNPAFTSIAAAIAAGGNCSSGPSPVTVPNVVGQAQATAESSIVAAGLVVGTVTTNNSPTVPAGDVISQNPAGGAQVSSGSSVDIVVSLGAASVSVPNVVGQAQATAESSIVAAGLVVGTVSTNYSPTVPNGDVISQNPAGGTQVASGSSVDIEVSLGAAPTVGDPACIVISPTTAGPGDNITLTAYDSNNQFVDLTNWSLVETGPWNCPSDGIEQQADADGTVTFELTDCWYNDVGWEFYVWNDAEQRGVELGLVGGSSSHSTVAAAIAAGGTCQ
jgi:beta-lactam-binding protein with PASTA domain